MTQKEAIEILTDHNRWRRSEGEYDEVGVMPKYSPTQIGRAIDFAIASLEQKAIRESEYINELIKVNKEWKDNMKLQKALLILKAKASLAIYCRHAGCDASQINEITKKFEDAMKN